MLFCGCWCMIIYKKIILKSGDLELTQKIKRIFFINALKKMITYIVIYMLSNEIKNKFDGDIRFKIVSPSSD